MAGPSSFSSRRIIDIFVGGPMGGEHHDSRAMRMDRHVPNMAKAVRAIAAQVNKTLRARAQAEGRALNYDPVQVHAPIGEGVESGGSIDQAVFKMIDRADLAIMDMSGAAHQLADGRTLAERPSPNVMYEVALLHSLGIPTIMVVEKGRPQPFYLTKDYFVEVVDYGEKTLRAGLKPIVKAFCENYAARHAEARLNPITMFYDKVALVDISSVSGLATAYFHNFLKIWAGSAHSATSTIEDALRGDEDAKKLLVLEAPGQLEELGKIKRIVTLKPRFIRELNSAKEAFLNKQLARALAASGRSTRKFSCYDRSSLRSIGSGLVRPYGFTYCGDCIIDVPMPLFAMTSVPRYMSIQKTWDSELLNSGATSSDRAKGEDYDASLIDRFVLTVDALKEEQSIPEENHVFWTLDELVEHLKRS